MDNSNVTALYGIRKRFFPGLAALAPYLYLIRLQLLVSLTYRFEVITKIVSHTVIMFSGIFLWKTVYHGVGSVSDVNETQMITYTVISTFLNSIYGYEVQNIVNKRIRQGSIVSDFIRPINVVLGWLADDIGRTIGAVVYQTFPIILSAMLFVQAPLPASMESFLLFVLSAMLSYCILWLTSVLVGLSAFWIADIGDIAVVKDAVVRIFSGSIIPLWLFPEFIQKISVFLPFKYIYQAPLEIYISRLDTAGAWQVIFIQMIWTCILILIAGRVWKSGQRRLFIQGG